jgi:hypothetical protein
MTGPSMAHDGPSGIWRWKKGARTGATADSGAITQVLALPQRDQQDKPEGLTVFDRTGRSASVLVVYDAPSAERKTDSRSVRADIYRL